MADSRSVERASVVVDPRGIGTDRGVSAQHSGPSWSLDHGSGALTSLRRDGGAVLHRFFIGPMEHVVLGPVGGRTVDDAIAGVRVLDHVACGAAAAGIFAEGGADALAAYVVECARFGLFIRTARGYVRDALGGVFRPGRCPHWPEAARRVPDAGPHAGRTCCTLCGTPDGNRPPGRDGGV